MRWAAMITLRVPADYERHDGAMADEATARQLVADLDETLVAPLGAPYAAYMSAQSASPPTSGTSTARSTARTTG